MKATLTIEIPNDFEKGEYSNCWLNTTNYTGILPPYCIVTDDEKECNADNCPLEIQDTREGIYKLFHDEEGNVKCTKA